MPPVAAVVAPVAEFAAHPRYAAALAFTPGDCRLLTAGGDGPVRVWDCDDWSLTVELTGHTKSVDALALAPDGSFAVTGAVDGTVRLWDLGNFEEVRVIDGHRGKTVAGVAVSPDGSLIASGGYDARLRVWEAGTGTQVAEMAHPGNVVAVAFSPDGRLLASGGLGDVVRLWTPGGEEMGELGGHERAVTAVCFADDGLTLVSVGAEDMLAVHAIDDWKLVRQVPLSEAGLHQLALEPGGRRAAASVDRGVDLVDLREGRVTQTLEAPVKGVYGTSFSPDGRLLAAACADGRVRVWETPAE